jgi:hypothetical protein
MKPKAVWALLLVALTGATVVLRGQSESRRTTTVTVRPATLADTIEELAGYTVKVPYARVVGVLNPRAVVVDTATALRPPVGNRDRLLVLVEARGLNVPASLLVGSTVTVLGVARTLVGIRATREVPWPPELRPDVVQRLEIRAAILARSVQTADGVELTSALTDER